MKKSTFVLAFLFAVMLAPLAAIAATWYAEYDAALSAIAAKDWVSAEAKLKTAMQLQPKQGRQVLAYGIRFVRYIPQYYLGLVYFHQAKYQDAVNQFQVMQKTRLVAIGDPEYSEMIKLMQQARERLKPKTEEETPPAATPPSVIEQLKAKERSQEAEVQAQRLEEEKRKREQFESLIQKANSALSAKDFRQSREFARQAAATELDQTRSKDLLNRIDVAEKLEALAKAVNKNDWLQAQRVAQQVAVMDPRNRELIRIQSLIDEKQTTQDLEDRGLLAFLSGDYTQAVLLLERVTLVKKDIAETWFYLGCSHAAMGLLKGKDGNELLVKAQREFAQARKLDSKIEINPGLISPRILEIYEQAQ